uniref:Adenosylmethionine decarboxylase n=1 Tax=viral metagenome TaxID=1070528 RepID=A0A6C0D1X1_9ZZZZ
MFKESVFSGKHLICNFKQIENIELLNSIDHLKDMCKIICKTHDFSILQECEHTFSPMGCTFLFLLSESHLSVHTFPEKNYIAFDLYTCREYSDNYIYTNIYYYLVEQLKAKDSTMQIIDREF